jgi:hypothetical protein
MSRRKYVDLSATVGEGGWTAWIWPVHDGYRLRCCDCELVHVLQFRVDDGDVGMRVQRDNRATAASRRQRKAPSVIDTRGEPAYTEMAMQRCRADAPLFAELPAAADPEDERMADLFADAAE